MVLIKEAGYISEVLDSASLCKWPTVHNNKFMFCPVLHVLKAILDKKRCRLAAGPCMTETTACKDKDVML